MSEWVKVGTVIVDSASLWLGDPAYPPRPLRTMTDIGCPPSERVCDRKGWPDNGIYFWTLGGDGEFPVYAQFDENGDVVRVMVDMEIEGP